MSVRIVALCFAVFISEARIATAGIIINLQNVGGTAPTLVGGGTLSSVVHDAAAVWELAFNDSSINHTLDLTFGWFTIGGADLGGHFLTFQGGTPHRETEGQLVFNSVGVNWFADGTLSPGDPLNAGNSEYSLQSDFQADFGGGAMNAGREFTATSGLAFGRYDLFTVALHEIGHALGMSSVNNVYQTETELDNRINVTGGLPFAGSAIPTNNTGGGTHPVSYNAHLVLRDGPGNLIPSHFLMQPTLATGVRRLPSAADILADAQLSQFSNPNLQLAPNGASVPEPGSLLALSLVTVGCVWQRSRRFRRTKCSGVPFGRPGV